MREQTPRCTRAVLGIVVAGLFVGGSAWAASTYYVAKTGNDSSGTGTSGSPWSSVTNAVAHAAAGDTVFVAAGIYTQSVSFAGRSNVTVRGGFDGSWNWDPANQASVIFGNGSSAVVIPAGANSNVLSYLTLRGGTGANKAGIEISGIAPYVFVEGCLLAGNVYGLRVPSDMSPIITLRNTVVARNTSGGISIGSNNGAQKYCYMYNCTVADNGGHGFANSGAGGDWNEVTPVARNSLFTGNKGFGIYKDGGNSATIDNCLFFGNTNGPVLGRSITFTNTIKSGRDPKYVEATNYNYRVQSDSPAAAAGTDLSAYGVTNDIVGATRPNGTWDMGAYEGNGGGEGGLVSTAYVRTTGSDTMGDGSSSSPWATISYALGRLSAFGSLYVAGGTYYDSVAFGPEKQNITIRGGYDSATWTWSPGSQATIIDGRGLSPIIIPPNADSNVLSYLTLKGGTNTSQAGILLSGVAPRLFVESCTIVSNLCGVYDQRKMVQTPILRNTVIARNSSYGIYFGDQAASSYYCYLYNCTIADNGADGFYAHGDGQGGWNDAMPVAKNTLFTGNKGYGLYKAGSGTSGSVQNCLFYGNTNGPMLYFVGVSVLSGNKSGRNPKYTNPAGLDYSVAADSPAAAAGMDLSGTPYFVTNDVRGVSRPQGSAWDMGAYESANAGESATPTSVYVSTNGSDTVGDGSAGSPWATIQYAVGRVGASGLVHVSAGTYSENVSFGPGNSWITLRGGYTPGTWEWSPSNQIVEISRGSNSPITIAGGANSNVLSYLTLKGGTAAKKGGIELNGIAPYLSVEGCILTTNLYGLYFPSGLQQNYVTLRNTLVARNVSHGVYFKQSFVGTGSGACYLYNCTVADNGGYGFDTEGNGSGGAYDVVPVAKNSLFTGNNGYGIYKGGGGSGGSMEYCLFYGNTTGTVVSYVGFTNLLSTSIKTGRDPKYVNPAGLDYAVQTDSPAAAAGKDLSAAPYLVTNDLLAIARPQPVGGAWDMGAYEGPGPGELDLVQRGYVRTTGSDALGDGSTNLPWATITFAIGHTASSGTVCVAGGTYQENVNLGSDRGATVRGGYDPVTWAWSPSNQTTIVNGNGNSPIVIPAGSDSNTLSYLTLIGGTNSSKAGIEFVGSAPNLFVEGCTIVSNYCGIRNPRLVSQTLTLRNNLIARNASDGIYFGDQASSKVYLYNCTLADNGGNGYFAYGVWNDAVPVAKNTLFTGNNGNGLRKEGSGTGGSMEYCLFHGNTNAPTYAPNGFTDLGNNKSGRDPKYVQPSALNYRVASDSPAAASGEDLSGAPYLVTNDLTGVSRPQPVGGAWDMGAYEDSGLGESLLGAQAYVSTNGNDSTGTGATNSPWATIGYALTHVVASGTVFAAGGTYIENIQLSADRKGATVRGGYDPVTWAWSPSNQVTIVDGNGNSPVMVAGNADSNTLSYLILRGGTNSGRAGIEFSGSAPTLFVEGCSIVSNYQGIFNPRTVQQTLALRNTLIARNASYGIYFGDQAASTIYLYNCTVADNGADGYYAYGQWADAMPVARNTLFTGNNGYGLRKDGTTATGTVQNCLFYGNASGPMLYYLGMSIPAGNKSGRDPKYINPAGLDYRVASDSPAAAAGTDLSGAPYAVTNDLLGVLRPQGTAWDMGAFESANAGEPALASSVYVSTNGSDSLNNGSAGSPWGTVQYAVGKVAPSGTVHVSAGVYTENVQFGPGASGITLQGGYEPGTWIWNPAAKTVEIDGNTKSAVAICGGAISNVLSYLTLKGGTAAGKAGIELTGIASNLLVEGCTIVSNRCGIYLPANLPQTVTVRNTLIARNTAQGILFDTTYFVSGTCYLYNCTLADNGSNGFHSAGNGTGGGVDVVPVAKNSLFTGNNGYGIYKGGGSAGASVSYCLFYGNAAGATNWITGGSDLGNNMLTNPPLYQASAATYYQLSESSPALNSGSDLTALGVTNDIGGHRRPQRLVFDRGAYELSTALGSVFKLR